MRIENGDDLHCGDSKMHDRHGRRCRRLLVNSTTRVRHERGLERRCVSLSATAAAAVHHPDRIERPPLRCRETEPKWRCSMSSSSSRVGRAAASSVGASSSACSAGSGTTPSPGWAVCTCSWVGHIPPWDRMPLYGWASSPGWASKRGWQLAGHDPPATRNCAEQSILRERLFARARTEPVDDVGCLSRSELALLLLLRCTSTSLWPPPALPFINAVRAGFRPLEIRNTCNSRPQSQRQIFWGYRRGSLVF